MRLLLIEDEIALAEGITAVLKKADMRLMYVITETMDWDMLSMEHMTPSF